LEQFNTYLIGTICSATDHEKRENVTINNKGHASRASQLYSFSMPAYRNKMILLACPEHTVKKETWGTPSMSRINLNCNSMLSERFVSHNLRATTTVDAKVDGFAIECVYRIVDTDLT